MKPQLWIRARDGAFHCDPMLIVPEGFIVFASREVDEPERMHFSEEEEQAGDAIPKLEVFGFLHLEQTELRKNRPTMAAKLGEAAATILGAFEYGFEFESEIPKADVVTKVPGSTDASPTATFTVFEFKVAARIPVPSLSAGTERYARSCSGQILDIEPKSEDSESVRSNSGRETLG